MGSSRRAARAGTNVAMMTTSTSGDDLEALRHHRHPRWMPEGYKRGDPVHLCDLARARDACNAARLEFARRHGMLDDEGRIDWHKFGPVVAGKWSGSG